jgi:nucleoside 2-deoxyribosyltransferase
MNRLRCFVAMRFGNRETDQVYDKVIAVVLRKLKITPVRVDRINHNENIDSKIIAELKVCDFALADLTFARPSVYFEAGFAQCRVPVIYTCRKDHIGSKHKKSGDESLMVHFDVLMRNIIPWKTPKDRTFSRKLAARVKVVTAPLLQDKAKLAAERAAAEAFSSLSMQDRIYRIRKLADDQLRAAGFRRDHGSPYLFRRNSREIAVVCQILASPSKQQLVWGMSDASKVSAEALERLPAPRTSVSTQHAAHLILCTLNKITPSRLHNAINYLTRTSDHTYVLQNPYFPSRLPRYPEFLHLIDGIMSEDDANQRLDETVFEIVEPRRGGGAEKSA